MKTKKAEFTVDQPLSVILGAAIVIILFLLLLSALGSFDKGEQAAKSLTTTLNSQIQRAEEGKTGLFEMPRQTTKGYDLYVIYFAGRYAVTIDEKVFFNINTEPNKLSVCYSTEEERECFLITVQGDFSHVKQTEAWWFTEGDLVQIEEKGEKLVFSKV